MKVIFFACQLLFGLGLLFTVAGCGRAEAQSAAKTDRENKVTLDLQPTQLPANGGGPDRGPAQVCGDLETPVKITPKEGYELATCSLRIQFGKDTYYGTGFFVTKSQVLTAGHNIVNAEGVHASMITVVPGGAGHKSFDAIRAYTVDGWVNEHLPEYDYGAIILPDSSAYDIGKFSFDLRVLSDTDATKVKVNIRGYPQKFPEIQTILDKSTSITATELMLNYELDTLGGQSGGVIWVDDDPKSAVAVHGTANCPNGGARITEFRKERILADWQAK